MSEEKVKIIGLELENVKRISLVRMAVSPAGLTVIGGDNAQGKTSIIDGIIYALGGEKYRPTNLQREGSIADARIRIPLSNGLIVERKGKKATLKITDPSGRKGGQNLLNTFIEELALNLPKFIAMKDDEKAEVLLQTLGIGEQLRAIDQRIEVAYNERHAYGQIVDQKKKYAAEMPEYHDVPDVPISAADIIRDSQAILQRNSERDRMRKLRENLEIKEKILAEKVERIQAELITAQQELAVARIELSEASKAPIAENESTAALEEQIQNIEQINAKVRANADKAKATADAENYEEELLKLTTKLEDIRKERRKLLENANMPLAELTIGKNERGRPVLLYNAQQWDCMSTMERYRVAIAIIKKLKPACGFVLLDGLESFDLEQLKNLNAWLESENLQAIATRVSKGEECSIIIEDGMAVDPDVEASSELPETNTKTETEREDW